MHSISSSSSNSFLGASRGPETIPFQLSSRSTPPSSVRNLADEGCARRARGDRSLTTNGGTPHIQVRGGGRNKSPCGVFLNSSLRLIFKVGRRCRQPPFSSLRGMPCYLFSRSAPRLVDATAHHHLYLYRRCPCASGHYARRSACPIPAQFDFEQEQLDPVGRTTAAGATIAITHER